MFKSIFKSRLKSENKEINRPKNGKATDVSKSDKNNIFHESIDIVKIRPELPDDGKYGFVGKLMDTLSKGTEAIPAFIGAEFLSLLSVSIHRGNIYTSFAASKTVPRVNSLQIAKTGEGKGFSSSQMSALKEKVSAIDKELLPPEHLGGVSTTEGIVNEIRDDIEDANGEIIKGVQDKRLFILEEEFANVFKKVRKNDSTLSATIRTLFDGKKLEPLIKYNKIGCERPHVVFLGHMTPEELSCEIKSVDIANGFMNRFPIFRGMKQPDIPFPEVTTEKELNELATSFVEILKWCNSKEQKLEYSTCYKNLWEKEYSRLRNLGAEETLERSLMTRAAHYASMYAMLFAVTDKVKVVTSEHLKAALAWIDYWHQSVRYIYNTELDAIESQKQKEIAKEVYLAIKRLVNENSGKPIGKTPLTKAFSGRYTSKEISDALKYMQELSEPPIKVTLLPRNKHEIYLLK